MAQSPFAQDMEQLFASLIVSMELKTHKQFFRRYENSFLLENAVARMRSLTMFTANCIPGCKDSSLDDTAATTDTWNMDRASALSLLQLFLDARLIEDAIHPEESKIWEYGIYVVTPKGLYTINCCIPEYEVDATHFKHLSAAQPIPPRFLHLHRRETDDRISLTGEDLRDVFHYFAGASPNFPSRKFKSLSTSEQYRARSEGILLTPRPRLLSGGLKDPAHIDACFSGRYAAEWLCDFTSVRGLVESKYILAHFVRLGLIELVDYHAMPNDTAPAVVKKLDIEYSFVMGTRAIYKITVEGAELAWDSEPHLDDACGADVPPPPYVPSNDHTGSNSSDALPSYSMSVSSHL